jgi:hypothetical protein
MVSWLRSFLVKPIAKEDFMKILLTLTLMLSSLGLVGSAKAANKDGGAAFNNNPQVRIQIGRRHRHDRDWDRDRAYGERVGYGRTFTRDVQYGRRVYRETYVMRNGRTFLVSRVRVY